MQAGAPLAIDLHWRCDAGQGECAPDVAGRAMQVTLQPTAPDGASPQNLWEGTVAPREAVWRAGEVLCRRLPLRLPADAPAGRYTLALTSEGISLPITEISLEPGSRSYDIPPTEREVNAALGDAIRLVGATIAQPGAPGQPLGVTLVWQALRPPDADYTVFVHLMDEAGKLVAQSDATPAGDYPTGRWIAGEVVTDAHLLTLPPNVEGTYRLAAGMYDPLTGARLPVSDVAGQPVPDGAAPLGQVQLP